MKEAKICTKKEAGKVIQEAAFIKAFHIPRFTDIVYVPIGILYGDEILVKLKIKKRGEYLILS